MNSAWHILRDGGLPLAIAPSGTVPTGLDLAVATRAAIAEAPSGRDAEALAAYLFAWRQHWPDSFATSFVDDGDAVIAWAKQNAIDDNRYLKLRRIALGNLSRIL